MTEKSFLPFKTGYLTDWMVKKAEEELGETDEGRDKAVEELRTLITKDKELNCCTDDAYLLQYLRVRKFKVKKAYESMHNFFTVKDKFSDVFPRDLDVDALKRVLEAGIIGYLPHRDENGSVFLLFRVSSWDPSVCSIQSCISAWAALILNAVEEASTQVCGIQILIDAQGTSLSHIRAITTRYIQLVALAFKNSMPVRYKGIHVFNETVLATYIYSIAKLFFSDKVKKRIHFHGSNLQNLHKHVPKEILPTEYGGDVANYDIKELSSKEIGVFTERYAELHRQGYS